MTCVAGWRKHAPHTPDSNGQGSAQQTSIAWGMEYQGKNKQVMWKQDVLVGHEHHATEMHFITDT